MSQKNKATTTKSTTKSKKSVAAQNEALLAQQNKALAEEYRTGVWAHTIGQPEVGGLLCRMPLEAELYYGSTVLKGGGYWKEKADLLLRLEHNLEGTKDNPQTENDQDEKMTDMQSIAKVDK